MLVGRCAGGLYPRRNGREKHSGPAQLPVGFACVPHAGRRPLLLLKYWIGCCVGTAPEHNSCWSLISAPAQWIELGCVGFCWQGLGRQPQLQPLAVKAGAAISPRRRAAIMSRADAVSPTHTLYATPQHDTYHLWRHKLSGGYPQQSGERGMRGG